MLINFLVFIFTAFIGMMCGVQGCIVGGTYDDGLDGHFVDYLNKHTLLFRVADKMKWVALFFGTPLILLIIGLVFVMFQIFCNPWFNAFLCEYECVIRSVLLIYFITMLVFYFVGYFAADKISRNKIEDYGRL